MPDTNEHDIRCPRCGGDTIIDYDETFDCVACNLEFEKKDLSLYDAGDILSIQEKSRLKKEFDNL